jgi:hypothetical protein
VQIVGLVMIDVEEEMDGWCVSMSSQLPAFIHVQVA